MEIGNIKSSGCDNTLTWAISNGADIKSDLQLQSIINDELFYLVTVKGLNFFQVFRLTQMYREKLRIIQEYKAEVPSEIDLGAVFQGIYTSEEAPDEKITYAASASYVIQSFLNLVMQMANDDDIVQPMTAKMYLPMISRKFDVQFPIGFIDFVNNITPDEAKAIFTMNYPNTLNEIVTNEEHSFNRFTKLAIVAATDIIKHDKRYDKYASIIRYSSLKAYNKPTLYKLGLLSFHKYDTVSRDEIRCSLFKANKANVESTLKRLKNCKSPLEVDFAVQLPIQYMQILENFFGRDMLTISYESSMSDIIDGGLIINDFVAPIEEEDQNVNNPEAVASKEKKTEALNMYRTRLTEANMAMMNLIGLMIAHPDSVDISSAFAMLPSIYTTKAVLTVSVEKIDKLKAISNDLLAEMFNEMDDMINSINTDINSAQ